MLESHTSQTIMKLISETIQENIHTNPDPKFPQLSPYKPEVDLRDLKLFTQGQPWEAFRKMREQAPVCWHPGPMSKRDLGGFWSLTQHADIKAVSRDTQVFSSQRGGIHIGVGPVAEETAPLFHASYNNMICMDGTVHSKLRKDHMPFFTPEFVTNLKKKVDIKVTELLDAMAPLGECDLVEMFSSQLPLFTLSEILGIPEVDRHKLVKWMHYLELATYISAAGPDSVEEEITPELIQGLLDSVRELFEYGRFQLYERRENKKPDLLNALAWADLEGALMGDEFLDGSWLLIVFAGNDTTRNTISGTMKLLTENIDQKQKLINNMALLPGMVEEAIRMVAPVMHMRRTATCDTQIGAQSVGEGEKVVMWYGAANRDPAVFENPDQFDIERANAKQQVAFGFGKHMCIGHRVARMQLESVFQQMLTRFPSMKYSGGIDIAPNNFVHAIRKLPVRFAAES